MTHQNYMNFSALPENETMMPANSNAAATTLVEETKKHRALYPEIHYKLKPYISVTCDAIHASGVVPTQNELDEIADNIHDEFCRMHPEMENYMKSENKSGDPEEAVPTIALWRLRWLRPWVRRIQTPGHRERPDRCPAAGRTGGKRVSVLLSILRLLSLLLIAERQHKRRKTPDAEQQSNGSLGTSVALY